MHGKIVLYGEKSKVTDRLFHIIGVTRIESVPGRVELNFLLRNDAEIVETLQKIVQKIQESES
jgi:hypothetical protein